MDARDKPVGTLRERTRLAMREEVSVVGIRLFAEKGFDAVTTTEIAQASGISPRSFFRYFSTKEDVVLGGLAETGERVRDALQARPAKESAWDALQTAWRVVVEKPVFPKDRLLEITALITETPSIAARDMENHFVWERLLVPNVSGRLLAHGDALPEDADDMARVLIGAVATAVRVTSQKWVRSGGSGDPVEIFERLLTAIRAR